MTPGFHPRIMLRLTRLLTLGLASIALIAPVARSATYGSAPLPLPETYFPGLKTILEAAVKQSPRMIAKNADNAAAEGNRIVLRSGQLPSVNGWAQYFPWDWQDRRDLPYTTITTKLNYNVTVTQPIYHWGALQNNTRIGALQLRMTQGQTADGYRLLVQEIRSQFLSLIVKKATLAKAHLSRQMAEDNFAASKVKLEKKVISDADMFMPTFSCDQSQLMEDRVSDDYENAKSVFAKLCGTPILSDDQIPNEIPDVSDPAPALEPILHAYVSQPEPESFALKSLGDQIAVEKLTYKNTDVRLRPNFNFVAGTSLDQQSYTTNIAQKYAVTDYFVGVQLNWAIFDGFAVSGAKASSLARRRQLEQSYKSLSADLVDAARSQYKQIGFSRRSMELSNRLLNGSVGALREKKADLSRGLASEIDVNTFQIQLADAQINAYVSRSDYLIKSSDFLSTTMQDPALANLPNKP